MNQRAGGECADFAEGALGAEVFWAHQEGHRFYKLEGVAKHQVLHLAIEAAAPVGAGEEGPADFDFTFMLIEIGEAGGADEAIGGVVDGDKCSTGGEGIVEKSLEDFFFIAVGV